MSYQAQRDVTLRSGMIVGVCLLFGMGHAEANQRPSKGLTIQDYHYASSDRRDPFQLLKKMSGPAKKAGSIAKNNTSHLSQARWTLLGIISGAKGYHAMIQSAEGQRYMVSNGDVLFSKNMRVAGITHSSVRLEPFTQPRGVDRSMHVQSLELTFDPQSVRR